MTDNEIIKALECCIHEDEGTKERPCQDCPLLRDDACSNSLRKHSLDLINRQKAEIENLRKVILNGEFTSHTAEKVKEEWHRGNIERINGLRAEIERLHKNEQIATAVITESSAEIERVKKESDEWERRFINRCRDYELEIQKNEKLKAKIAVLSMKNADFDIENKAKDVFMDTVWPNLIKNAKTEAVREFAESFEKKIKDVKFTLGQTWEIQNALKDTLKEMVGDDK